MLINGENLISGRLASIVAKKVIKGEMVTIINAEKVIIVGTTSSILPKYKQRVEARVLSNPHYGPKYDRIPSKILKHSIKGMLPGKSRTNEALLKQIKIFNLVPKNIDITKAETIEKIKYSQKGDFMYLGDVAKSLGGKW